jgi:hypothetical protein
LLAIYNEPRVIFVVHTYEGNTDIFRRVLNYAMAVFCFDNIKAHVAIVTRLVFVGIACPTMCSKRRVCVCHRSVLGLHTLLAFCFWSHGPQMLRGQCHQCEAPLPFTMGMSLERLQELAQMPIESAMDVLADAMGQHGGAKSTAEDIGLPLKRRRRQKCCQLSMASDLYWAMRLYGPRPPRPLELSLSADVSNNYWSWWQKATLESLVGQVRKTIADPSASVGNGPIMKVLGEVDVEYQEDVPWFTLLRMATTTVKRATMSVHP